MNVNRSIVFSVFVIFSTIQISWGMTELQEELYNAVKNKHHDRVATLLAKGTDPEILLDFRVPAILYAARMNDLTTVKLLLHMGANPDPKQPERKVFDSANYDTDQPIYHAIQHSNPEMLRALIRAGATTKGMAHLGENKGRTPISHAMEIGNNDVIRILDPKKVGKLTEGQRLQAFENAISRGDLIAVKQLYSDTPYLKRKALLNHVDLTGDPNTMLAAQNGYWDILYYLIDKGADINKGYDNNVGLLAYAVLKNNSDLLKYALSKGADINQVMLGSLADPKTPVMAAIEKDYTHILKILLEGCSEHVLSLSRTCPDLESFPSRSDGPPLIIAADKGNAKIVRMLIDAGANINFKNDKWSALHWAADNKHLDAVKVLVKAGASLKGDNDYYPPLAIAAYEDNADILKLYLAYGADVNERMRKLERPAAMDRAILKNHTDNVKVLIDAKTDLHATDSQGETYLTDYARRIKPDIAKLLIDAGLSPRKKNNEGETVLALALKFGNVDLAKYLLSIDDSDPLISPILIATIKNDLKKLATLAKNQSNSKSEIIDPVIFSAENNLPKALSVLLKNGVNSNVTDVDSFSPLILAVKNGHLDTVKILAKNKIGLNYVDKYKTTALAYAVDITKENRLEIAKVLLKYGADPLKGGEHDSAMYEAFSSYEYRKEFLKIFSKNLNKRKLTNAEIKILNRETSQELGQRLYVGMKLRDRFLYKLFSINASAKEKSDYINSYNGYSGNVEITKMILSNEIDDLQFYVKHHPLGRAYLRGKYTLKEAIKVNSEELIQLFINNDIFFDPEMMRFAIESGNKKSAVVLINNYKFKNRKNSTAENKGRNEDYKLLSVASKSGHIDIVRLLIKKGAPVNAPPRSPDAPLFEAIVYPDILRLLIKNQANIYATNDNDRTALDHAFRHSYNYESVKVLIEAGSKPARKIVFEELEERNPFMLAMAKEHRETRKVLPPSQKLAELADKVHWDFTKKLLNEMNQLLNSSEEYKLKYDFPLHEAIINDNEVAVMQLVKNGADLSVVDSDGHSPLGLAAYGGNPKLIKILMDGGASINQQSGKDKLSPLHYASLLGQTEAVKRLIKVGALSSRVDSKGRTPLQYALHNGHLYTAGQFIKAGVKISEHKNSELSGYDFIEYFTSEEAALFKKTGTINIASYMEYIKEREGLSTTRTMNFEMRISNLTRINPYPDKNKLNAANFYVISDSNFKFNGKAKDSVIQVDKLEYIQNFKVGVFVKSPIWLLCSKENGCSPIKDKTLWPKIK